MKNGFRYLAIFAFAFIFIIGGVVNYSFADTMESLSVEESISEENITEENITEEVNLPKKVANSERVEAVKVENKLGTVDIICLVVGFLFILCILGCILICLMR